MTTEWPNTSTWPKCKTCQKRLRGFYTHEPDGRSLQVLNMNTKMIHFQGEYSGETECGREATEDQWLYPL